MKILSVESCPVTIPLKPERVMINALGVHTLTHLVVVAIRTDTGVVGYGEANGSPTWSGETQEGMIGAIRHVLAPCLIQQDPFEVRLLLDAMDRAMWGNPFAKAALEMALLDIVGKTLRVPVFSLLGGGRHIQEIPLKFSVPAYEPAQAARAAEFYAGQGFGAVKIKVGMGTRGDIARVQAVRSALGADFHIAVDANGGWSETETADMLPQLERLGINALEQPISRLNLRGCARLRQRTSIPIVLDESIFTREQALEAIRLEACDLISIYPGKNGGVWRSVEIADLAAAAGLECIIGSNLEMEIASSCMLHLATSISNLCTSVDHEIIGPLYHSGTLGNETLRIRDGKAVLFGGIGLGLDLDFESLKNQDLFVRP
jgi:L-alanine-DL-glutamate epimerase-like enolase superfamily enzyme